MTRKDFAQALSLSPAWATQMLSHQRDLDPTLVGAIAEALRLDPEGTSRFEALVDLQSRSARTRRQAWATLNALSRHGGARPMSTEEARAFGDWWVAAIVELARCEGFRPDPVWISQTIVPAITADQAGEALRVLETLGALVADDEGVLRCSDEETWDPSDLPTGERSRASARAQADLLRIGAEGLSTFAHNERWNVGIVFAASEDQLPALRVRLGEVSSELGLLTRAPGDQPNRVYALCVQLTPLSNFSDD